MKFFGKSVYTRFIEVLAIMVIMVILMGAYRIVLDSGSRKTASQKECSPQKRDRRVKRQVGQ